MSRQLDCTDIKALMSAIVDDQLDAETRHAVERELAECPKCRALVDEAEALNDLIRQDAEAIGGEGAELPLGFEAAVLSRTADDSQRPGPHRYITWGGWFAAAASLLLAVTILYLDRQGVMFNNGGHVDVAHHTAGQSSDRDGDSVISASLADRSWTYDGDIPDELLTSVTESEDGESNTPIFVGPPPADQLRELSIGDRENNRHRVDGRTTLTASEAASLRTAGDLMNDLVDARTDTFQDVETIRRRAEFNNTLEELAALRRKVSPDDRPLLHAAQSLLFRVVRGPISQEDVQQIQQDARELELAGRLHELGSTSTADYEL